MGSEASDRRVVRDTCVDARDVLDITRRDVGLVSVVFCHIRSTKLLLYDERLTLLGTQFTETDDMMYRDLPCLFLYVTQNS